MKAIWLLLLFTLCSGCTMGVVTVKKSELDNSTHIAMTPATAIPYIALGLSWNDKLPRDELTLEVIKTHGGSVSGGESLHFNIDGELINFTSFDSTAEIGFKPGLYNSVASIPGHAWSSRRYTIPPTFLKKLLNARKVVIRVDLDREYAEGILVTDPTFFLSYAPDFMAAYEDYHSTR